MLAAGIEVEMSVSEGLRIISVAKALFSYQSDPSIAEYFGATQVAGRTGLLLSSLRHQSSMEWRKLKALAANACINGPTLNKQIRPWLEGEGFIEVYGDGDSAVVRCNVIDYDAILTKTSELFRSLEPSEEEILVLEILELGIRIPTTKSDAFGQLPSQSEEVVSRALELADGYSIVKILDTEEQREPVFYSPLIWGDNIKKAGKALSHLHEPRRSLLLELIEKVRAYQGLPEVDARQWSTSEGDDGLIDFGVGLGLIDRTDILTSQGTTTSFLTTPHLYGEIAATQGKDVCDRIRLFLDSIRHGQHYGQWLTGRISEPVSLLNKLINTGEIGQCTAIGRDYVLVERAGVVKVRQGTKPGQYVMELIQKDTVELIRDILANRIRPLGMELSERSGVPGQDRFISAEQVRAKIGKLPKPMREAEAEMIRKIREMV